VCDIFPAREAGGVHPADIFPLESPKISAKHYSEVPERRMAKTMDKTADKSRREQQNSDIVALTKSQNLAGNARAQWIPAKQAQKRRAPKPPVCLTTDEKDQLFRVIKSPRDHALFSLMYFHGLRASEPGKLMYSDFRPGPALGFDRLRIVRLKGSVTGLECALVPMCARSIRRWIRVPGLGKGRYSSLGSELPSVASESSR
jgi:integrase